MRSSNLVGYTIHHASVLAKSVVLGFVMMSLLACQPRATREDPILGSVRANNGAEVRAYLLSGGDPNKKSRDGDPLLYVASGPRGGEAVARLLIEGGADVNAKSRTGRTAFENAVGWCDLEIIALLVAAGVDIALTVEEQFALKTGCVGPSGERKSMSQLISEAVSGAE